MITALIDPKHKVIMDWSPKGGSTILVKMFFKHMGLLEEAYKHHSWIHEYRMHVYPKSFPITLEDLKNPEYFKFKVVRNPFHRAVSSYIHTMKYEVMHPPLKKSIWRWSANISFKSFVSFLEDTDLKTCDPHYSLQKKEYEYDIPNCFDEIIHLRKLPAALQKMNAEKGFNFNLEGLSSEHHASKNLNSTDVVANKRWSSVKDNIPGYKNFYTDKIQEKVFNLYREDFDSYGFSSTDI